ncbi:MAG: aromatic ring-hydroxylating dioxygenase subunit alpha [Burkholderiales bacterium]|nr:aromatic ring-hydroxylating dioxygenase subunit alpha [Burkholderiales bacterium]
MLTTRQKTLRRFWYPVVRTADVADKPVPFRLMGEDIVIWRNAAGQLSALADRCCHRTAKLSRGWVDGDLIVCHYHGWAYDSGGVCQRMPQTPGLPAQRARVTGYRTESRYGYVWVCLGEPLAGIPEFEETDEPGFRLVQQFYERWECAPFRLMENSLDPAHVNFVHKGTFGRPEDPVHPPGVLTQNGDAGFTLEGRFSVKNPPGSQAVLHGDGAKEITERRIRSIWYLPFVRKSRIAYPDGLVHSIVTCATPVDDGVTQVCQWAYRNDTEEEVSTASINAFDAAIVAEDRYVLETTDPDVPLAAASGEEKHMATDAPGLLMRKMLLDLLARHGEEEVRRSPLLAA